jgi:hypothetical protein
MMRITQLITISALATSLLACRSDRSSDTLTNNTDALLASLPPAAQKAYDDITKSPFYKMRTYQDCVVDKDFSPEYPFILSPRRQTDSLTRQLYNLLPQEARDTWAYVIPDRLVQNPERYLAYLAANQRRKGYIIGSIAGTSSVGSCKTDEKELLVLTYNLLRGIGYPTKDIRIMYSKGDSPKATAEEAQAGRESKKHDFEGAISDAEKQFTDPESRVPPVRPRLRITWGADEVAMLAFAHSLGPMTMSFTATNQTAPQHYEAKEALQNIVTDKATDADLKIVSEAEYPDIRLVVHSGNVDKKSDDPFPTANNVAYVDRRRFANGAQDANWAPTKRCNALAYAAWGTAANSLGSAMATAKIVYVAGNEAARSKLFFEAIAHDIFFIGYSEREKIGQAIAPYGVKYDYIAGPGNIPDDKIDVVFAEISRLVQAGMAAQFAGTNCTPPANIRMQYQLKRFFEADVISE